MSQEITYIERICMVILKEEDFLMQVPCQDFNHF
jgi:hypothetical protein